LENLERRIIYSKHNLWTKIAAVLVAQAARPADVANAFLFTDS
jgi:hypothetical protein